MKAEEHSFAQELFSQAQSIFEAALPSIPCVRLYRPRAEARARMRFFKCVKDEFPELFPKPVIKRRKMRPLEETIAVLSAKLLALDPGPLAELRRMEPDGVGTSMFWRLVATLDLPVQKTDVWMQIVRILAILTPSPHKTHRCASMTGPFGWDGYSAMAAILHGQRTRRNLARSYRSSD